MARVALVSGSTAVGGIDATRMRAADAALVDALARRSIAVEQPAWRDTSIDWSRYDLAVVRTTWDYVEDRDAFVAWALAAERATTLCSSADVLRWNTHKGYLIELEERGAPVVATAWLAAGDKVALDELLAQRQWSTAVLKPAVGAGSSGLQLVSAADPYGQDALDALLAAGDVLIQPYLEAVEKRGELSVVVVEGAASHAVRKIPQDGEFRVQEQYGSCYRAEALSLQVRHLAEWIVAATGHDLLVARVDLLEGDDGTLQLVELEATEPDLYFSVVPDAAEVLAEAICARVASAASTTERAPNDQ